MYDGKVYVVRVNPTLGNDNILGRRAANMVDRHELFHECVDVPAVAHFLAR